MDWPVLNCTFFLLFWLLPYSPDDQDHPDDRKSFPIVFVVAPVASVVTALLVAFVIWWRMRRRILGK
jgi:hypothetical protein